MWLHYNTAGHTINQGLVDALSAFHRPQNRTDVRSFSGLVQQIESLSPDLTDLMEPIRALLSPKVTLIWTEDQQVAFEKTIKEVTSPRILTHYRAEANLRLETDAAKKPVLVKHFGRKNKTKRDN